MAPVPMYGGYAAVQQYWHPRIHSNLVYGITVITLPYEYNMETVEVLAHFYKYAQYFAANTFWNVYDFATVGVEYLYGQRVNTDGEKGNANRINFLMQYKF